MSTGSATSKKPKKGKVDRLLAVIGKNAEPDKAANKTTSIVKPLVFKTDSLVPQFNEAGLQRIVLSGSLVIELRVEMTGQIVKQHQKNDLFAVDVEKLVAGWFADDVNIQIANMTEVLKQVDGTNLPTDKVQRAFESNCTGVSKHLSDKLESVILQYLASNKAIKAHYRRYQVNCVSNVVINVVAISAWIGVTAASWGATGPVAVVGIVRGCVGIGVDLYNMAIDVQEVIRDIELYFNAISVLMIEIDEDTKNPKAAVAWNTATEVGLGAIAGILNVPVPSVSEIENKMSLLENKIKRIHLKRLALGKELTKLRAEIENYQNKINENAKASKSDRKDAEKHLNKVAKFNGIRESLFEKAERLYEDIQKDLAIQKEFDEQLATYKANQKSFSRKTRLVFGFATSIGLSVGTGGSNAEYGIAAMNECLILAVQQISDL
jgi:hypothetical protein